mgnify:FL=1
MELKNKSINFLGDSITAGYGTTGIEYRYDQIIAKECDLKAANNYGIGGTCIAYQWEPTIEEPVRDLYFCGRAARMDKNADIILVFGGINDYLHGDAPIGTMDDKTPKTFCGAVFVLMQVLRKNYPNKTVAFLTPPHCNCWGTSDKEPSKNSRKRADALPVKAYVDIILRRAKEFGFPVLDLYRNLGIDPNIQSDKEKYTIDGLHLNNLGHAVLAQKVIEFLRAL